MPAAPCAWMGGCSSRSAEGLWGYFGIVSRAVCLVLLCRSDGTRERPTASVLASCFPGEMSIRGPVPWSHPPWRHGKRKLMARPPVEWESPVAGSTAPSQQWRCQLQSLLLSVDSSWDGVCIFCGVNNLSGVGARVPAPTLLRLDLHHSSSAYLVLRVFPGNALLSLGQDRRQGSGVWPQRLYGGRWGAFLLEKQSTPVREISGG